MGEASPPLTRLHFAESCDMLISGKKDLSALPVTMRRLASPIRRGLLAPFTGKEGDAMLTFSDLFQFCLVIIGVCGLFIQVYNGKKK